MNSKVKNSLIVVGIPTIYAIFLRVFFGVDTWDALFTVMSITFIFLSPFIVGVLTVLLSKREWAESIGYRLFMPWVPIFLFFIITVALSMEGWACWIMVLPVFMIASSFGGMLGGYLKLRNKNTNLNISILVLLPLFLAPVESMIDSIPGNYEAYTCIDIEAPSAKIWNNVTRVREISETEDSGVLSNFLGFPRPVKAELDFNGVGAYREAIFTNGLVFHETVTEYQENKKMVFTIKANTFDIPSTTLDEHILIGGDYFDVLNGTYELEDLGNGKHRLHLYSNFEMNTHFNFYAGWWGKWIMKDIQNNILRIEKQRAENDL